MFIIPVASEPNQSFSCTIPIDGRNMAFDFTLRYNWIAKYWVISVADGVSKEVLLESIPLLAGEYPAANLLEQYQHLRIGSAAVVKTNPDNTDYAPDGNNLGVDFLLVWGGTIG